MSVLVGFNTRLVVQGMSGSAGAFHAKQMVEYGTRVVAGVTPGKGGAKVAGLAMSTMDIIKYYGGAPANFSTSAAAPRPRRSPPRSRSSPPTPM